MRKTILIAAVVVCLAFVLGGIALLSIYRNNILTLNEIIKLYQVAVLRERLLVEVEKVQSELRSKDTRFSSGPDTIVQAVVQMGELARQCSSCHHTGEARRRNREVVTHIRDYDDAISRVLTIRANEERVDEAENAAFIVGVDLIKRLRRILDHASANLEERTHLVLTNIDRTFNILLAFLVIGTVVVVSLALLFIRSLTRPIAVLLEATRHLKAGDLDHRITGLRQEFSIVGDSFNDMAGSLKQQMEKMQHTEQMAVSGRLATGLAHEIKNPLTGIKTSLQVLAEETTLPDEDREMIARAGEEISRINVLINGLLDYARPREPAFEEVDVNEVVERAILFSHKNDNGASDRTSERHGEVLVRKVLADGPLVVVADPAQLLQVCLNLLLNGFEAMPAGGTLTVMTARDAGQVSITVSDQGHGIPTSDLDKIFEPFFTKKRRGTGLGLAISQELVLRHGGTIVASNSEDGGAQFAIRLPANGRLQEGHS